MVFQPQVNQQLAIESVQFRVAAHPAAPGMPYGQEGRQATVYQLVAGNEKRALKVFKPRFRVPALVMLADRMSEIASMPGLSVCKRTVLTPRRYTEVLREHADLTYAVLMPWVEGPTWTEVMLEKRLLSADMSLRLARSLVDVLASMEERGLAHCDLSGSNLLLPALAPEEGREGGPVVELVDTEQMFAPDFIRPEALPAGSQGYGHRVAAEGLWNSSADRFAGAVLVGEILGWCDRRVREAAWGESCFDPNEMQIDSARAQLMVGVLRERWGAAVSALFERAWQSDILQDCPTFGEWLVALPHAPIPQANDHQEEQTIAQSGAFVSTNGAHDVDVVELFLGLAERFEQQGSVTSAIETYRYLLAALPAVNGSASALSDRIARLQAPRPEQRSNVVSVATPARGQIPSEGAVNALGTKTISLQTAGQVRLLHTLEAHKNSVSAVAFHPSGEYLASASWDCTVAIWHQGTAKLVHVLKAPVAVVGIAFSPDGKILATARRDGMVFLWSVPGWQQVRWTQVSQWGQTSMDYWLTSMDYSPDGEAIATSSVDHICYVWSVQGSTRLQKFHGNTQMVRRIRFSPDGKMVASAGDDNQILVWGHKSGDLLYRLQDNLGEVRDVAFSSNSAMLASATHDGRVRVWQLANLHNLLARMDSESGARSVAFTKDNSMIVSGTDGGDILLWSLSDYQGVGKLSSDHTGSVNSLAFSPDGRLLASGSQDHSVKLWGL